MMHLFVALFALALPAPQDAADLVHDEIRFAENLARFHFFPLAFDVLDRLDEETLVEEDQDLQGNLELTRARIQIRVSSSTADEAQRLEYQGRAIDALDGWYQPGTARAYHERRPDALEDLARALVERGKLRARLRRQAEDQAATDELRASAAEDFRHTLEVLTALHRECEGRATQLEDLEQADDAAQMWIRARDTRLLAGLAYLEWAEVAEDAEHRLEQAVEALVDYQWELEEEGTLPQYVAMEHQARALSRLGQNDEALEVLEQVLEELDEYFLDEFLKDPPPFSVTARTLIAQVLDDAHFELARLHVAAGDADAGQAVMGEMRARHERVQQPLGRAGHAVLIEWAEMLRGLGKGAQAAAIAKEVAEAGKGTPEGDRASQMLADPDLLAELSGPGSGDKAASPGVLLAAAKGFVLDQKYHDAVHYFEVAIGALQASPARTGNPQRLELEAWTDLGRALQWDKRFLESALAFEHLLDLIEGAAQVDEELRHGAALKMYYNFQRRHKETGLAFDKRLRDSARDRLAAMGIRALQFDKAQESFAVAEGSRAPADYLSALEDFEEVDESSSNFERALVFRARCLAGANRLPEALAVFDEMLARADDPGQRPTDPKARSAREIASADAILYKSRLLMDERVGRVADVIALTEGFAQRVPGQRGHHELVAYQRLLAFAALGADEEAAAALEQMEQDFPDSSYVSAGAFHVATTLDAAASAADDEQAVRQLRQAAATAMWKHCETSGFTSFTNVLRSGDWFVLAGEPELAERSYREALARFGTSEEERRLDDARIGLASVLNDQAEFGRARDLWKDLVRRYPRSTGVLQGTARCYSGWLEEDAHGTVTEVPGSGDYMDGYYVWLDLFKGVRAEGKYTHTWWEAKLGQIYTLYRESAAIPERAELARKLLNNLKNLTPDYDEDTKSTLPAEQQYSGSFKQRFRYLDRRIP